MESSKVSAQPSKQAPLRVLHVYAGNLYGGIETFLRTLAEERAQCPEMEPEFALCFEGRLADEIRASGAPLHMLGGVRLSRPWTALRAQARLRRVIRARRPDVIVCHAAWPHALFAPVAKLSGTHVVFYRHDIGDSRHWTTFVAAQIRPSAIIANSHFTSEHGFPAFAGVPSKVVRYVMRARPAHEGPTRETVRRELGVSSEDFVILQASRMQAWKGQALLVDALAKMPRTISWQCWFAGDAQRPSEKEYVEAIRAATEKHGISDRVRFLGQRSDVPDLMHAADVFSQPNVSPEPFGIVFVEALSAGLPVVSTTSAGGALETLTTECAIVCSPTPDALAEALTRIAENRDTRNELSRAALKRGSDFTRTDAQLRELAHTLGAMS